MRVVLLPSLFAGVSAVFADTVWKPQRQKQHANHTARGGCKVEIYYESLCPDSISFFQQQFAQLLDSGSALYYKSTRAQISLYPYGNVNHGLCQHGQTECYGNRLQACLLNSNIDALKEFRKSHDSIEACSCMMSHVYTGSSFAKWLNGLFGRTSLRETRPRGLALSESGRVSPMKLNMSAVDSTRLLTTGSRGCICGLEQDCPALNAAIACAHGTEGENLHSLAGQATIKIVEGETAKNSGFRMYVPWTVINGVRVQELGKLKSASEQMQTSFVHEAIHSVSQGGAVPIVPSAMATMRAVLMKAFGPASNLFIGEAPRPARKHAKEALVKIKACGINRGDTTQRIGKYPPPPGESEILGLEMVGQVEECADDDPRFSVGSRVMAILPGGGYSDYCTIHDDLLLPIPDEYNYQEAACIPESYLTGFQLLKMEAQMKEKDNVLVHAAAGGVGVAMVQLANCFGAAKVVATCSGSKVESVVKNGADLVIDYGAVDGRTWSRQVKDFCGGVDVVIDPVAGAHVMPSIHSCKVDAKYITYAAMSGGKVPDFDIVWMYMKRIHMIGSTLRNRPFEYKKTLVSRFESEALPHFRSGGLKICLDKVFKIEDVAESHEYVENNRNVGKVVLSME